MSISLPGLATGMDTTDLVNQLMQVERIPQQQLLARATSANRYTDALRNLNSMVAALGETAAEAAKPAALRANTATSSQESVTVTASTNASPGELSFTVSAIAARHTVVTEAQSEWPSATFEYTDAEGESHSIEAASSSISDIARAINRSDAPLSATAVSAGDGTYRLQLTAADTGARSAFTVADVNTTTTTAGSDAEILLWAGTEAEQRITSTSNTFTGLIDGVDVTVFAATTTPVTIGVERDEAAAAQTVEGLVEALQSIFTYLGRATAVSGDGDEVSGSVLTGDSTARMASSRLQDAALMPINGQSLSTIGIEITRQGEITFDEEKLRTAFTANPEAVEEMFGALAQRVSDTATALSDRYEGLITGRITGQETNIRRMEDQAAQWDVRLQRRRASLERTYAQLEVAMQQMNSQMDYLQNQLAQLPAPAARKG